MTVIYNTATTLNGFIADENNSLQWLFDVPGAADAEADSDSFFANVGAIVMGSTTYEWLLKEMKLIDAPSAWTAAYGDRPTWVFSSRDLPLPQGTNIRVINSSVADALSDISASTPAGTNVWVMGGGDLAGQFYDAGALDEIILTVAPVFLPAGKPTLPRRIESGQLGAPQIREVGQFTEMRFNLRTKR
ncbi:dihydrofolate reductase family protein [Corynebacterium lubricantis]|uniref:dihydrofolate reductase family protein n=1 Tax=Corynebacterium lubricantis TaxID=541095 RepID=UPI00035EAD78|nr:dihydrofolate reductase family protein [Corynebacterium lubricantis]